MKELIVSYIEEADLVDVWRKQHPHDSQFTFHRKLRNQFVFSRLDYFWYPINPLLKLQCA